MNFKLIDVNNWNRKEHFNHYLNDIPCTYSMTANLDVTSLLKTIKEKNIKIYPTMIYMLSSVVNNHEEFRCAINPNNNVGVFDKMNPSYTVFHKETETFSSIWTEYSDDFSEFYHNYLMDIKNYGEIKSFLPKSNEPLNTFPISSIPWTSFTGFNLNLQKGYGYLLPIFTTGKYFEENEKMLLPISIQVHHAVCDGFHVSRFINELQEKVNNFKG